MSLLHTTAKVAATSGLIINLFAGGGGTAIGIKAGMGRAPHINVNHARDAIAMHMANHPEALHFEQDVWGVDPKVACDGQDIDIMWLSPDCRHFSKAKGAKPVSKKIRGLANVAVKWAHSVRIRQGILLENVEEFETWGPLIASEKGMLPCPVRKGEYFRRWVAAIKRAGATSVDWRTLRACDYGAPTIRKRLFLIARFDGKPIVWPAPTHAHRDSEAVKSGRLLPFRTAADCIDWSLPCPSIFERVKDLKDATCRRIAVGIVRYVIEAAKTGKAFIVPVTHQGSVRLVDIDNPLPTVTGAHGGELALVQPTVVKASSIIVPVTHTQGGNTSRPVNEPLATVTTARGGELANVRIEMQRVGAVVGCGGRAGQSRPRGMDEPLGTSTSKADACIVEATLEKAHKVAAFMAQHNAGFNQSVARAANDPVSAITQTGSQQQLVTANLVKLRGTCADGQPVDEPMPTLTAGGTHVGLVYAFLVKYYGTGAVGQAANEPLHTATHQARFGLVTVTIDGEDYVITDIGMRMLTPRELARAQGFPDSYILDPVCWYPTKSGKLKYGRLPVHSQIAKIGNSVCPVMAEVLTGANFGPDADTGRFKGMPPSKRQYDLFADHVTLEAA